MPATLTKALLGFEAELDVEMTLPLVASVWWLPSIPTFTGGETEAGHPEGAPGTGLGDPHPDPYKPSSPNAELPLVQLAPHLSLILQYNRSY